MLYIYFYMKNPPVMIYQIAAILSCSQLGLLLTYRYPFSISSFANCQWDESICEQSAQSFSHSVHYLSDGAFNYILISCCYFTFTASINGVGFSLVVNLCSTTLACVPNFACTLILVLNAKASEHSSRLLVIVCRYFRCSNCY